MFINQTGRSMMFVILVLKFGIEYVVLICKAFYGKLRTKTQLFKQVFTIRRTNRGACCI